MMTSSAWARFLPSITIIAFLLSFSLVSTAEVKPEAKDTSAAPEITFEQKDLIFDLGVLQQNQKGERVIHFTNTGNSDLHLKNVRSSCGCTAVVLSSETVPAGEKGEIKVTLDPGNATGQLKKYVYFESDDPKQSKITTTILARVRIDFIFEPYFVSFGRIGRHELKREKYAKVQGENAKVYFLTGVRTESPFLEARILESGKDFDVQRVVIKLRDDVPLGRFRENVTVTTTHPDFPEIRIPVSAVVTGHIKVKPERVHFRFGEEKKQLEQEIVLTNPEKKDFTITSSQIIDDQQIRNLQLNERNPSIEYLQPSQNDLQLSFDKADKNGTMTVKVRFMKKLERHQRCQGTLRLFTDDPNQKEIDIQYYAYATIK